MSKQKRRHTFTAKHRFTWPNTEEVTTKEKQDDSIASVTCPNCKGVLYIGTKFFFAAKLPLNNTTMDHLVIHCTRCRTICKVEILPGVELPVEQPPTRPSQIPNMYRPPHKLPLRWQDDVSGIVSNAVKAFFAGQANADQVELVRDWCQYYIDAPCWDANPHMDEEGRAELAKIREKVKGLKSAEEIRRWIHECLGIGLDPF